MSISDSDLSHDFILAQPSASAIDVVEALQHASLQAVSDETRIVIPIDRVRYAALRWTVLRDTVDALQGESQTNSELRAAIRKLLLAPISSFLDPIGTQAVERDEVTLQEARERIALSPAGCLVILTHGQVAGVLVGSMDMALHVERLLGLLAERNGIDFGARRVEANGGTGDEPLEFDPLRDFAENVDSLKGEPVEKGLLDTPSGTGTGSSLIPGGGSRQGEGDVEYHSDIRIPVTGGGGINTGGGSSVGGDVSAGRDFVGRDQITNIYIGAPLPSQRGASPSTSDQPKAPIKEQIRLDVATPESAVVDQTFDMAVSIRQLQSPPLKLDDLAKTVSAQGVIFRSEETDVVRYRVEVSASDCKVKPASYTFLLRSGEDSQVQFFQITPSKAGRISIIVNAYQDDGLLAASTRVVVQTGVPVTPNTLAGSTDTSAEADAAVSELSLKLYDALRGEAFSLEDLEDLAFRLRVDWDNLSGDTKQAKARALVRLFDRRGALAKLQDAVKAARPELVI
jgi:hypothetical protein